MSPRRMILAVLNGGKPDTIPCYAECLMDVTVLRGHLPPDPGPFAGVKKGLYEIQQARFFDNSASWGAGVELECETLSKDRNHHRYCYETGAVWYESHTPTFSRKVEEFPIKTPQDALLYRMPDVNAPGRFNAEKAKECINTLKHSGYFVEGSVCGVWYGIYYYLTSFENILMWMAIEPAAAQALFDMTRWFSIESAKKLLACGVDSIFTASDLGSARGTIFSRDMFYKYVFPWLKELADLCHENHAYLHLHSHGHIQELMDDIIEAGVDIINPIGPGDNNDLVIFKRKWGDKITLHGGISTRINNMTDEQMREHLEQVIDIGRKGGRFFPRTESGIPPMPPERIQFYLNTLTSLRRKGYT